MPATAPNTTATPSKRAPRHLSTRSRQLWSALADDYGLHAEPHAMATLTLALEALDRCTEARKRVDAEGLTITDRHGQPRVHPLIAVERDSRLAALRAFRELALEAGDVPAEARPPRIGTGALS